MATHDRDWIKNRVKNLFDDQAPADTDWVDEPAPEWPELIRLAKHRLENALRIYPMDDPRLFLGLIETLMRLYSIEKEYEVSTAAVPD